MGYDFYAHHRITDERAIDATAATLKAADLTTVAQVLATGLAGGNSKLSNLVKNGRDENDKKNITGIGGYPGLLRRDSRKNAYPLEQGPGEEDLAVLPPGSALIEVRLKLTRPWHSKDDRGFYPHDNPVKKEWVFGVPYLAASGIKGLLRWAWRMRFDDGRREEETCLFGPRNDRGLRDGEGWQGCLVAWPLFWQGRIILEVINPQNRATLAGTQPIKYEVVGPGATGTLRLLVWNRGLEEKGAFVRSKVLPVLDALDLLVGRGGISAKRSSDWGSVEVTQPGGASALLAGFGEAPQEAGGGPAGDMMVCRLRKNGIADLAAAVGETAGGAAC